MAAKKATTNETNQNANLKRSWQQRKSTAPTPKKKSEPRSQSDKREQRPLKKRASSATDQELKPRSGSDGKEKTKKSVSFAANEKLESGSQNGHENDSTPKKRKLDAATDNVTESNEANKRFKLTPNNWQKRQQAGAKKKSKTTMSNASKRTTSKQTNTQPIKSAPKGKQIEDSALKGSEAQESKTTSKAEINQANGTKSNTSKPQIWKSDPQAPRQEVHKEILKTGKNFKITKTTTTTTTKPAPAPSSAKPAVIHSTYIPEPEGLVDQLSTSEWDMYSEKMPDNVAGVVIDRIDSWLMQQDSAFVTELRTQQYGEELAAAFPDGETPGYAKLLFQEFGEEWLE